MACGGDESSSQAEMGHSKRFFFSAAVGQGAARRSLGTNPRANAWRVYWYPIGFFARYIKAINQGSLLLPFPKGGCVVRYGVVLVEIRIECTKDGFGRVLATKRTTSRSDENSDASTVFILRRCY